MTLSFDSGETTEYELKEVHRVPIRPSASSDARVAASGEVEDKNTPRRVGILERIFGEKRSSADVDVSVDADLEQSDVEVDARANAKENFWGRIRAWFNAR